MFDAYEYFLNLEAVIVHFNNLVSAWAKVIGQYVPRFFSSSALGRSDDAKHQSKELNHCIFFFELPDLYSFTIAGNESSSLQANVERGSFGCKMRNNALIAEPPVKHQFGPEAQAIS